MGTVDQSKASAFAVQKNNSQPLTSTRPSNSLSHLCTHCNSRRHNEDVCWKKHDYLCEEQRQLNMGTKDRSKASAVQKNNSQPVTSTCPSDSLSHFCSHCNSTGHTEDVCWKKHDYHRCEEQRQFTIGAEDGSKAPALAVQKKNSQPATSTRPSNSSPRFCTHCNSTRHTEDVCWKKHKYHHSEEQRQETMETKDRSEASALAVQKNNSQPVTSTRPSNSLSCFCTHCNNTRHTEDVCWKKHNYHRCEEQRQLTMGIKDRSEAPAVAVQKNNSQPVTSTHPSKSLSHFCTHCNSKRHTEDVCWKKHGYSEWYKLKQAEKKNKKSAQEYHASNVYHPLIVSHAGSIDVKLEKHLGGIDTVGKDKGVYIGIQEEDASQVDTKDDLEDIWREMSMAIECSKDVSVDPLPDEEENKGGEEEDCDHSFVLKDDLGYVCRVCGVIGRGIETIFEFQYKVKKSTRTYMPDSWNAKNRAAPELSGLKFGEDDLVVAEISAHPRHMKQMKPHQVEGFNFLVRNLVGDNPGGCILAHAPGSGKTFMIICFMQSFLGKYPNARPLVVLPKGILATWKKEFQIWQVEDVPLYDFYSVKADSRAQQLEVLKQWVEQKSILFLGYKQFSSIVCDSGTSNVSMSCQEILLKAPSILILDEGHTPRNDNTDMVQSLAKVQTPRKVVLSGTLYQNHVKEVFSILNLVRPKFLCSETSRPIVRRILSRVDVPGKKKFFDQVEITLQNDPDFKRKVAVIQDLREMTNKVLHYYKGDFLDELPGLVDFTVVLNLTPRQKNEAQKLKHLARKFKISSVGSAVYLHPQLKPMAEKCAENCALSDHTMDEKIDSLNVEDGVKSKFFLKMLNLCDSSGEKLLVFSQYLLPLKYLERLSVKKKGWSPRKEIFVISGESSSEEREWSMQQFNNSPDAKVFFGSIKACGEGISLVGASRIIILDVHLNPSVTRQAIGRAFRPGQRRKVFAYRLVAADSPEEEDHDTCFKKELISRMWFEWNEYYGFHDFEVETVDAKQCGDLFLESPLLREDIKVLYKR